MGDLREDLRTRAAAAVYRKLPGPTSPQAQVLLEDLGPDELVKRFLENVTFKGSAVYTAITTRRLLTVNGFWRAKVRTVSLPLTGATLQPGAGAHVLNLIADDGTALKLTLPRQGDVDALIQLGVSLDSAKPAPTLEDLLAGGLFTPGPTAAPKAPSGHERHARGAGTSQRPPSGALRGTHTESATPQPAPPQAEPPRASQGRRHSSDFRASRTLITWQDAEAVALEHMVHLGFVDVMLTGQGADGGLDVTGARAAAQVKHHGTAVSAPRVQQLAGAAHRHEFKLFYATAGYTTQAQQFAAAAGVHLFTIFPDGRVVPENPGARALWSTAADRLGNPLERSRLQKARRAEEDHELYCKEVSSRGSLLVSSIRPLAGSRSRRERRRAEKAIAAITKSIEQLERGLDGSKSLRERRALAKGADRQLKSIAKELGVKLK